MSRHFCLASGMAALCLMSASPFADASTKAPTPGLATPIGPTAAARDITRRLLGLLSNLGSTAEVTPEHIGKALGVSLNRKGEEGATMYLSPDVGSGWNFGVSQSPPQKIFKAGLRFWFYNPDPAADPGPICSLNFESFWAALRAHGYVEQVTNSEIGGVEFLTYAKNNIRLVLGRRDVAYLPDGTQCIISIQTSDGI
jgi:hypothetical protein